MNDLSKLTRPHYEKDEAGAGLVSKVTKIPDSLPAGSVDSSQRAGLDQFHERTLLCPIRLPEIHASVARK